MDCPGKGGFFLSGSFQSLRQCLPRAVCPGSATRNSACGRLSLPSLCFAAKKKGVSKAETTKLPLCTKLVVVSPTERCTPCTPWRNLLPGGPGSGPRGEDKDEGPLPLRDVAAMTDSALNRFTFWARGGCQNSFGVSVQKVQE